MGKGGGGGQPQTTTAYQTNLPEYAKPYVENMLNAAQKQVYNDDMTSFRPYTPYSSDPSKYFAGPSGLQQSTYGEAANMQTPGGFGAAQGLTGLAAMGQMGAGRQFAQQATNPYAVQAYMSPYMQNVVDTQKTAALRDFQVGQTARQGQQTLRGAFGGSRSAIENAEAQRALNSQLQGIQAQGTQQAFQNAQQQQQFGANLGLQGLAGASQSAGLLGQLAGSQQQADIARLGLQNQLGGQQQQYQQGIINQAVQDYATQQQYPMLQLANMSNLLRGLPMQSATTQTYQAAPNALSQLGGLGATALGVYGASGGFRAAQGGEVKSYAEGGEVASYAPGGVVGGIEAQLMQMDIPQLTQVAKTSPSVSIRQKAAEIIAEKQMAMQTKQSMGLEGAPAPNLDDIGMAGGGIIAFSGKDESLVKEPEFGSPEYDEKYGAPGSLKRKFKSIADYYASPSSKGDFSRNVSNTLNALAPVSALGGANAVGMPRALGLGQTTATNLPAGFSVAKQSAPSFMEKLFGAARTFPAANTTVNAVLGGEGGSQALPVPAGDGRENPAAAVPPAVPPGDDKGDGKGGGGTTAEGKYESEIQAMMADLKKGLGEGRAQKDLDALREEIKERQGDKLWMSLIQGGAKAMQSTSPHAMVGLGSGLEAGAKEYGRGMEAERADKKLLLAQQSALEQAEYARKTGNLNALIAAQTRLDTIKMQRETLAAGKESQLETQRMKVGSEAYMRAIAAGKPEDEALAAAQQSLGVYDRYKSKQALPADQQALNWLKTAKVGVNGVTQNQIDGVKSRLQAKGLV
jgi:hypothetical protein